MAIRVDVGTERLADVLGHASRVVTDVEAGAVLKPLPQAGVVGEQEERGRDARVGAAVPRLTRRGRVAAPVLRSEVTA
ncbi:hypothetical protein GCM10009549_18260 [Streptomyces thermoalcalitolerans]|uniref:Uncharacterized protein n=1 Tax=Streptomyces thermoalcalitolerans TaxID=65605 RepID=A0ABN1NJZ2_9ACTN